MFIAVLFTIVKTWKQLKCLPKDDKYINIYIYIAATWMNLEIIILGEVSQKEKEILYDIIAKIFSVLDHAF